MAAASYVLLPPSEKRKKKVGGNWIAETPGKYKRLFLIRRNLEEVEIAGTDESCCQGSVHWFCHICIYHLSLTILRSLGLGRIDHYIKLQERNQMCFWLSSSEKSRNIFCQRL